MPPHALLGRYCSGSPCLAVLRHEGGVATPQHHGTRRFASPIDSVAAVRSSVVAEMFCAITHTVLFDHTFPLSSIGRVDDTSAAVAKLPAEGSMAGCGFAYRAAS
jgi:hypothetical protein